MAITERRVSIKPYEYPHLLGYRDAIRHSYWLHTEFNLTGDIQDWRVRLGDKDRLLLTRAMLAISQVEVDVKTFWASVYWRLPKPEIAEVGMTFAESEVRHMNAYSHLLELLGLDQEFERLVQTPEFAERIEYLRRAKQNVSVGTFSEFVLTLMLFSAFVEHISLFGQFLILMAYNKHRGILKGVSNIVEATSKEEQIHGQFGIELVRIFREEYPDVFDRSLETAVYSAALEAYLAERRLLEWMFEAGDTDVISLATVDAYLRHRFNRSLESLGYQPILAVQSEQLEPITWFEDEILSTKETDFFHKRSINYFKGAHDFSPENIF